MIGRKIDAMPDDLISVIDLAVQHGRLKQSIFKVLKRLRIEPTKRLGANSRGQAIAYITQEEARIVIDELGSAASADELEPDSLSEALLAERGVFYLLSLEPTSDPGRFKVGFAASLPERLRHHRCSAPFATVVATWPCKRLWEYTAIDCVTEGCERISREVFRTAFITTVQKKCAQFFSMMPSLSDSTEEKSQPIKITTDKPAAPLRV